MNEFPDFTDGLVAMLRIHTQLNHVEVSVNGVVVFENRNGRQVTVDWPVNEWLHRGENTVRAVIQKPFLRGPDDLLDLRAGWTLDSMTGISLVAAPSDAGFKAVSYGGFLWCFRDAVFDGGKWLQNGVSLSPDAFDENQFERSGTSRDWPEPEAHRAAVTVGGNGDRIVISWSFDLPASWPACDWADAAEIEDTPGYRHSVNLLYKSVHEALADGDLPRLRALMAHRSEAYARAYHLTSRSAVDDALRIIPAIAAGDWEMRPLELFSAGLFLHPNKKIVELRSAAGGRSPIQFITEDGTTGAIEVALSCNGGRWTWIR